MKVYPFAFSSKNLISIFEEIVNQNRNYQNKADSGVERKVYLKFSMLQIKGANAYSGHPINFLLQGLELELLQLIWSIRSCTLRCIPCTLKCLSIGTPKAINFPFVSNEKLMFFRCPSIQVHCNETVIYLNFGTPKNNEFSIWNKWKIYYF